jgi:hypothetical protein
LMPGLNKQHPGLRYVFLFSRLCIAVLLVLVLTRPLKSPPPSSISTTRTTTARHRSASPYTPSVFDTSAVDNSQVTILTEPDTSGPAPAPAPVAAPAPRLRPRLTREQAREVRRQSIPQPRHTGLASPRPPKTNANTTPRKTESRNPPPPTRPSKLQSPHRPNRRAARPARGAAPPAVVKKPPTGSVIFPAATQQPLLPGRQQRRRPDISIVSFVPACGGNNKLVRHRAAPPRRTAAEGE